MNNLRTLLNNLANLHYDAHVLIGFLSEKGKYKKLSKKLEKYLEEAVRIAADSLELNINESSQEENLQTIADLKAELENAEQEVIKQTEYKKITTNTLESYRKNATETIAQIKAENESVKQSLESAEKIIIEQLQEIEHLENERNNWEEVATYLGEHFRNDGITGEFYQKTINDLVQKLAIAEQDIDLKKEAIKRLTERVNNPLINETQPYDSRRIVYSSPPEYIKDITKGNDSSYIMD